MSVKIGQPASDLLNARFNPGRCFATPAAIAICEQYQIVPFSLVGRHIMGDHGQVEQDSLDDNIVAGYDGERVMSAYRFGADTIWVITDPGHETTTLLTPDEY